MSYKQSVEFLAKYLEYIAKEICQKSLEVFQEDLLYLTTSSPSSFEAIQVNTGLLWERMVEARVRWYAEKLSAFDLDPDLIEEFTEGPLDYQKKTVAEFFDEAKDLLFLYEKKARKQLRKTQKPNYPRAPKTLVKRERAHPCPNCDTGELMLKPNGNERWPLCGKCHWEKKNSGSKKEQRAPASLAAPSAVDHAAIVGSARQKMMTAVLFGSGSDLPEVLPKTPRRRSKKENGPRYFGDPMRDAGERRVWLAKQKFAQRRDGGRRS